MEQPPSIIRAGSKTPDQLRANVVIDGVMKKQPTHMKIEKKIEYNSEFTPAKKKKKGFAIEKKIEQNSEFAPNPRLT